MMLIGFGYLMAIIKTNGWSAIGLTFLINALVVQIYILTRGFWEKIYTDGFTDHTIKISVYTLMQSEFAVASCLIAFGGVIGRVGPFQIFIMFLIQVFGYSLNEEIIYSNPFNAIDYGGSLSIHVFGAIYGLVVSYIIGKKKNI
jgi:ammonium transporter Rh